MMVKLNLVEIRLSKTILVIVIIFWANCNFVKAQSWYDYLVWINVGKGFEAKGDYYFNVANNSIDSIITIGSDLEGQPLIFNATLFFYIDSIKMDKLHGTLSIIDTVQKSDT